MPEPASSAPIEIPQRALFKAAEVCDLLQVQPYVLRSWEAEFPALGVSKAAGGPRVYRRADVEQVLRIKHLLLVEGLTIAGVRRKLEDEVGPVAADLPVIDELIGQHARERLTDVKRGLQSILELLSPPGASPSRVRPTPTTVVRAKGTGKVSGAKRVGSRAPQTRRDKPRSARAR
jgi:DNA-binding transcriptional MerR regulator